MTVRIGFCGTGGIASAHLKNVRTLHGAEIVGLFDTAPGQADAAREMLAAQPDAARKLAATVYPSVESLIADAGLDALYVCVPPFAHGEAELQALDAGLALYVEKPVALSADVARQIAQAVRRTGVVTAVGYQLRYLPSVRRARELLAGQPIGMMIGHYLSGLPPTPWWRVMAQSGGQMVEQATHTVDMMRFLAGSEITTVYAQYALQALRDQPGLDIPDVSALTVRFASGAVATLSASCLLGGGIARDLQGVRVVGRDLLVHVAGAVPASVRYADGRTATLDEGGANAMLLADTAFVDAVAADDPTAVLSPYADGARSAAISWAANESARTGHPVQVDLAAFA